MAAQAGLAGTKVPASNSSGYPLCQAILVGARPKPHGTQKLLLRLHVSMERFSISAQVKSTPKTGVESGLWRALLLQVLLAVLCTKVLQPPTGWTDFQTKAGTAASYDGYFYLRL